MRREQQVIDRPREMMPDAYYNDALVQAAAHSAMYAGMESFRYGHIDKGTCLRRNGGTVFHIPARVTGRQRAPTARSN
jgi:hypothetical protein